MLVEVEVRTRQGALLLPLESVSDGIAIESIEGLDPVKATIVSSSFATLDGAQYQSSRREARNIKFQLGLEPDYVKQTVRDIRSRLYGFFMPKTSVDLTFRMADGLSVDISGTVESFESVLFSNEPVVNISIMCFDPDFYEPEKVLINGSTVPNTTDTFIDYVGTVEAGINFTLIPNRDVSEFTIYNSPPDGSFRSLDFSAPLLAGDLLSINTLPGQKEVALTRNNTNSSMLYAMSPQSSWIDLQPGSNSIRVYAEGAPIQYIITYSKRYGGL